MVTVTEKINEILKEEKLSHRELSKFLKKNEGYISHIFKGDRPFSKTIMKKLVKILKISQEEIESWIIVDKYPKKFIEKAVNAAKNKQYKRKPVLTQNLDKILQEKNISRTVFAKAVKYDQSSVNKMINCQKALCTKVLKSASEFLEISEDEIQAWVLADKYSLKTLEQALTVE